MFKYSGRYWLCQLGGWGGWTLINLFFAYQFASDYYLNPESKRNVFFIALLIDFICFIGFTHLLREVLKRIQWLKFSFTRVLTMFLISTVSVGLLAYFGSKLISEIPGMSFDKYTRNEKKEKAIEMESELQLAGTNYYNYEVNSKIDSTRYTAFTKIKKATGWYRNANSEWKYFSFICF